MHSLPAEYKAGRCATKISQDLYTLEVSVYFDILYGGSGRVPSQIDYYKVRQKQQKTLHLVSEIMQDPFCHIFLLQFLVRAAIIQPKLKQS